MSVDAKELAAKIKEFYPEIDKHNLKMDVSFNTDKEAWVVKLNKDEHELVTHVEKKDAEDCMEGIECVYLGHQIGQFIRVYCEGGDECATGDS